MISTSEIIYANKTVIRSSLRPSIASLEPMDRIMKVLCCDWVKTGPIGPHNNNPPIMDICALPTASESIHSVEDTAGVYPKLYKNGHITTFLPVIVPFLRSISQKSSK